MNGITAASPDALQLGVPRAEGLYLAFSVAFFTIVGFLVWRFLCRENKFRNDLEQTFGIRFPRLSAGKGLAVLLPMWVLACGWFYMAGVGTRFFHLRPVTWQGEPAWELGYRYPARTRMVPAEGIAKWTGELSWARRSMRQALLIELKNGRTLRSAAMHPQELEDKLPVLKEWGIDPKPQDPAGHPPGGPDRSPVDNP